MGEVDGGELVAGLVIVLMEAEAGDGLGDDALASEGDVVGALEEVLFGVGVVDEVGAVFGEFGAEVGALVAGEPEGAFGDGGIWTADHFKFEIGDDSVERNGRVSEEGARAEAAELFGAEEGEDDGPAGTGTGGEDVGEGENGGGAGGIVVGAVVDEVGVGGGCSGYAEVIEVRGEEDDVVGIGGAAEDGDGVPCLFAWSVLEFG